MVDTVELLGDRGHSRVVTALFGLLVGASAAFLLGSPAVRGLWFFVPVFLIAGYAGRVRAGWLAATGSVFVATFWWFVFGPLVGLYLGSNAARYAAPRMKDVEYTARGEVTHAIDSGIAWGVLLALLLGTAYYFGGWLLRQVEEDRWVNGTVGDG